MVPSNRVAIVTGERFSTNSMANNPGIIRHEIKPVGVARLSTIFHSISASSAPFVFAIPVAAAETIGVFSAVLPAGSELSFSCEVAENGTSVFFGADIMLVDENLVTLKQFV